MITDDRPPSTYCVQSLHRFWIFWTVFRRSPRLKLVRYAVSGSAVAAGYTVTVILLVDGLGWMKPTLASALSFVIWTPPSYLIHRNFSFLHAGRQFAAMVKFTFAFFARLCAAVYTVQLATAVLDCYLVGVLANWIILPLIGYLIMDFWIFRSPKSPAGLRTFPVAGAE